MPQSFDSAAIILPAPVPMKVERRPGFDIPPSTNTDFAQELSQANAREENGAENRRRDSAEKPEATRDGGDEKVTIKAEATMPDGGGERVEVGSENGEKTADGGEAQEYVEEKLISEPFGNPLPPGPIIIIPEPRQIMVPPMPGEPGYSPPGAIGPKLIMLPPESPPSTIDLQPISQEPPKFRLPIAMIDPMMGEPVMWPKMPQGESILNKIENNQQVTQFQLQPQLKTLLPTLQAPVDATQAVPATAALPSSPGESKSAVQPQLPQSQPADNVIPANIPVASPQKTLSPQEEAAAKAAGAKTQAAKLAEATSLAAAVPPEPAKPVPVQPSINTAANAATAILAPDVLSADAQSRSHDDTPQDGGNGQSPASLAAPSTPGHARAHDVNTASPFSRMLSADPTPAEQMVAQVKAAASKGESRIQIQLSPGDLGRLDIRLHIAADGQTKLSIVADNNRTLEMLRSDVVALERMLTDVGLKADSGSLSFNLREGGQQQAGQGQGQGQQNGAQQNYRRAQLDPLEEALAQTVARAYAVTSPDGLDIHI